MATDDPHSLSSWWRGQRVTLRLLLPVALALVLVFALAVQLGHATHQHKRAVTVAMRDYSAFATWQFTRRASDFLRLTIGSTVSTASYRQDSLTLSAACASSYAAGQEPPWCLMPRPTHGFLRGTSQNGRMVLAMNHSTLSREQAAAALKAALAQTQSGEASIGLVPLDDASAARGRARYVGYAFHFDHEARWTTCDAVVLDAADLAPVFSHVAAFAPLLPPSLVDSLPNASLVSLRVSTAAGEVLSTFGGQATGRETSDELGPALGGLRVGATLQAAATSRLLDGQLPVSNTRALSAMLVVTLVLCGVAVVQVRRMQEIVRVREDFVASVSHELKTPLAQISLFADTLASRRDRPHDERRRYATIISQEARRLAHLVNGILHFARMTRADATEPAPRERLSLGEEIQSAVTAFAPLAESRGVTLHAPHLAEVTLPVERDAMRQLLLNVFDNALKYGPDGQRIVIALVASAAEACITIDDEGPGIPRADRERVFEPFVRMDRQSGTAGSGIGLAVVRDVVKRHGGRVRVTDSPAKGTRVEIHLPLEPLPQDTKSRADATATATAEDRSAAV